MGSIRRQLLSFVLGSFICAAAVLGLAGPAAAHDAAESSSPAQGASVAVVPEQVSVTFNNNPLGIGSSFSVKDAAGTEWADGTVEIVDNVASQKLKAGAPAGQYTVAWRVVSSDSHPIEGTFSFTAAAAAGGAATSAGTTAAATVPAIGTAQPGQTAAPESTGSGEPFQWSIVLFAAVAVGLLATLAFLARRRLAAGRDDEG
ncbi:Copper resistance CopC family protein [Arthrobacter sp. 9AX]|uniref:copper resistance CopC family protein n=1 Tax=Arthrobacter sp. 9AX TaxID=2653131 RepID=UPI0012F06D63|nr:copper resistance CopC family protein [Arthrobacter sp. 9AX]VXC32742.1 Copper resistance CopC family protein [Arthrobacter sp. 9AX]